MEEPSVKSWHKFTKLRPARENLLRGARRVEAVTLKHAHTFILSRFDSIKSVRRHALGWLSFVGLIICVSVFQLIGYQQSYSMSAPSGGGTFAEGVVGPLEVINPIFSRTNAEQSASRLIFSGLLSYDVRKHLRGELADTWRAENDGKRYVVNLRKDIKWHDGEKITADDVVFTIGLIKNPLVRSPLYSSWSQVKVSKLSESSVAFDLSRTYAAFPHALTFGILPRHLLGTLPPERLRESDFNRQPVGSGPFVFSRLQVVNPDEGHLIVYMNKNPSYIRGTPKLDRFQLHVFNNSSQVKKAFILQEINAATDLTSQEVHEVAEDKSSPEIIYNTLLPNGMYAFLRNDSPTFSDKTVRQAFVYGTNRSALISRLNNHVSPLNGPLTIDQLPSMANKKQAAYDSQKAAALLEQAGWKLQDTKRVKDGSPLLINVVGVKSGDYPVIVEELKSQWEKLGATVMTKLVDPDDVQQTVLVPRAFDVLVYELELGADPDVFAYWHSSQADPRGLNLSNYKSSIASDALSSAQLRLETSARLPKYELFVDAWLADAPAIALYQPQLHLVTSPLTEAVRSANTVANKTDRYRSVELWTVEKAQRYTSP